MIGPKSPFFMGDHCGMVTMPRPLGAGFPGPSRFGEAPGTPNEATWPPGSVTRPMGWGPVDCFDEKKIQIPVI